MFDQKFLSITGFLHFLYSTIMKLFTDLSEMSTLLQGNLDLVRFISYNDIYFDGNRVFLMKNLSSDHDYFGNRRKVRQIQRF